MKLCDLLPKRLREKLKKPESEKQYEDRSEKSEKKEKPKK